MINLNDKNTPQSRILLATIILSLMIVCFNGGILAQVRKSQKEQETSPLTLKITTATPKICFGTNRILLEAEIKNVSSKIVVIDKYFLWNNSLSGSFDSKIGNGGGWAEGGDIHGAGDFLQLKPKEKYSESYEFVFADRSREDFFNRIGQYTINVRYQATHLNNEPLEATKWLYIKPIESNLKIHIIKCRKKQLIFGSLVTED